MAEFAVVPTLHSPAADGIHVARQEEGTYVAVEASVLIPLYR